jgi:prevent-host-death family protein
MRISAMKSVNMLEAKTQLSKLVDRIERGQDREILIARNGRPAARLVPVAACPVGKRIGLLKGKFKAPSLKQLDAQNAKLARLFAGTR